MRKVLFLIMIITAIGGVSCKKYLNINNNPNSTTSGSANLVLPQAIVNTATLVSNLNDYGGVTCGYTANAGGYGGFGSTWTYDYQPSQGEGYWDYGYQILENCQYIINATEGDNTMALYNAPAKIIKAYVFQLLVDEFNDIPFTDALQGATNFRPKYDAGSTIYPQLALMIDSAIAEINAATGPTVTVLSSSADPLFNGDMTRWKQFGNTLKLRLIVRGSPAASFANTTFTADGFLTTDAVVNPGYKLANASSGTQVSPSWNAWATNYTGARVGQFYIPAYFVYGYYDGTKLSDPARGAAIYFGFPNNESVNQLGVSPPANTKTSPSPAGAWYSGSTTASSPGDAIGVLKGPDMGEPLMLLAESDFLQAEADIRGILNQNAASDFNNGILASFTYLEELPNLAVASGMDPAGDAAAYATANSGSYLVNFSLATTTAQQTEAIITQKYIALNYIHGEEAWSEYRRTGYPVSSPTVLNNPYGSMASTQSQATRPDHLPTRLPYPSTEAATNATNVPQNISIYTSTIFWAH